MKIEWIKIIKIQNVFIMWNFLFWIFESEKANDKMYFQA